jgi:hypothetical protein
VCWKMIRHDTQTSTMVEYTNVITDAQPWGYCTCDVYTRAWAKAVDYASTDAFGEAYWETSWQWQGPPSTPPGGTLSWSIYVEGSADAWGDTNPGNGGSAVSDADGSSGAFYARSTGSTATGGGTAYGSVEDSDYATGDAVLDGQAQQESWSGVPGYGYYDYSIGWKLDTGDYDFVASGTSFVQVLAGVFCDGTTYASASGAGSGSEAEGETITEATATSIDAELTWE